MSVLLLFLENRPWKRIIILTTILTTAMTLSVPTIGAGDCLQGDSDARRFESTGPLLKLECDPGSEGDNGTQSGSDCVGTPRNC